MALGFGPLSQLPISSIPILAPVAPAVVNNGWFQELIQPTRRLPTVALITAATCFVFVPEPVNIGWLQALSTPQRVSSRSAALTPFTAIVPGIAETVTVDKWLSVYPNRITPKAGLQTANQQFAALHPNPVIKIDWLNSLSTPTIPKKSPPDTQKGFAYSYPAIVSFGWNYGWVDPVKPRVGTPPTNQLFGVVDTDPVVPFGWNAALSEYPRIKTPPLQLQQADPITQPAPATVSLDWNYSWSNPVRLTLVMPAAQQDFGPIQVLDWGCLFLLLQDGSYILLEDGFRIELQASTCPPPSTGGDFTVSGSEVIDRFPTSGVVYTYAAITKRTN